MFAEKEAGNVREALRTALSWPPGAKRPARKGATSAASRVPMRSSGWDFQRRFNRAREFVAESPQDVLQKHAELEAVADDFAGHVGRVARHFIATRLQCGAWRVDPDTDAPVLDVKRFTASLGTGTDSGASEDGDAATSVLKGADLFSVEGEAVELLHDGIRYCLVNHPAAVALLDRAHENAFKVASREIHGRSILGGVEPLREVAHVPVSALLNFCGWGVFACCDLDMNSQSLVGGVFRTFPDQLSRRPPVADAVNASKAYDHIQRIAASQLGLRGHTSGSINSFINCDAQVHLAPDGKFYAASVKRLMPPAIAPVRGVVPNHIEGSINESLHQRFRPEFLRLYSPALTLSSDAWMQLRNRAPDAADLDILQASRTLLGRACDELVRRLLLFHDRDPDSPAATVDAASSATKNGAAAALLATSLNASTTAGRLNDSSRRIESLEHRLPLVAFATIDTSTIKQLFHAYGVNLRYMGRVTEAVERELLAREERFKAREALLRAFDEGGTPQRARTSHTPAPAASPHPRESASRECDGEGSEEDPRRTAERAADLKSAVLDCLRIEMAARAARDVLRREWRKLAARYANALASGGSLDVGGSQRPAADLDFDHVFEEWTLDWLMRVSGDGLSYLGDSDAALWTELILPQVQAKFGYRMCFRRSAAGSAAAGADGAGAGGPVTEGGTAAQLTLDRVRRRANGEEADAAGLRAGSQLSSEAASASVLARRAAASTEPRTLKDVAPQPRPIAATGTTNWGTLNDETIARRPGAVVQVGGDGAGARVEGATPSTIRVISEWAVRHGIDAAIATGAAATKAKAGAGGGQGGADAGAAKGASFDVPDDDDTDDDEPQPDTLDNTAAGVAGGTATSTRTLNACERDEPLPIGPGGVSFAAMLDFCRQARSTDESVRLGARQDWRMVHRICQLTGVTLMKSRKSVLGVWCSLECSAKPVRPAALEADYVALLLDGDFGEAERRTSAEIRRRRKSMVHVQGGAAADLASIDLWRRLAQVHRFCGRAQHVRTVLKKVRDYMQHDMGSHELGIVPILLSDSVFELVRGAHTEAVDAASHALMLADASVKNSMHVASALAQLLDALDAQGYEDASTKKRKNTLVARLARLTKQLNAPMAKIEAREAILKANASFGPLYGGPGPDAEIDESSTASPVADPSAARIGSSRRSSVASSRSSFDDGPGSANAPAMNAAPPSRSVGNFADNDLDSDAADADDPLADLAAALEPDTALRPLALAVLHLEKERGLTDADTVSHFTQWMCYRALPKPGGLSTTPKHSGGPGKADLLALATAARALTLFVAVSNNVYAATATCIIDVTLSRLSAQQLCERSPPSAAAEPHRTSAMQDAIDSPEFSDLVALASLLLRGYCRNVMASVPRQHLHAPWQWDMQLSGAASSLLGTVHRLAVCPAFAIPVSTVVIDTVTSLTATLHTKLGAPPRPPPQGRGYPATRPFFAIPLLADRAAAYLNLSVRRLNLASAHGGGGGGAHSDFAAFSSRSTTPTNRVRWGGVPPGLNDDTGSNTNGLVGRGAISFCETDAVLASPSNAKSPTAHRGAASDACVVFDAPGLTKPITGVAHGTQTQVTHPSEPLLATDDWLNVVRGLIAMLREHGSTQPVFRTTEQREVVVSDDKPGSAAGAGGRRGGRGSTAAGAQRSEVVTIVTDSLDVPGDVLDVLSVTHWGANRSARGQLLRAVLHRQASLEAHVVPWLTNLRDEVLPLLRTSATAFGDVAPHYKPQIWGRVLAQYAELHAAQSAAFVLPLSQTHTRRSSSIAVEASATEAPTDPAAVARALSRKISDPPQLPAHQPDGPPRERTQDELRFIIATLETMTEAGRHALGAMDGQRDYERVLATTKASLGRIQEAERLAAEERRALQAAQAQSVTPAKQMRRRASVAFPAMLSPGSTTHSPGLSGQQSGSLSDAPGASSLPALRGTAQTRNGVPTRVATFAGVPAPAVPSPSSVFAPSPSAGTQCTLALTPTRVYGGEPVTVEWRFPKMVLPRHAWIGVFADDGEMNADTALARYEGLAVRKLRGSIDVLLPPTIGDYRVAYFTSAGRRAGPHEGMFAGAYLLAPRNTAGPIASPARVNFLGSRAGNASSPTGAEALPTESVVIRPSWVPFDTKRAKDSRMSGAIMRSETERASRRPQSLSPTPTIDRNRRQLPPMASTPPPKQNTEYVCVDDYADEQRSKEQYSKNVLTLVRKQQKAVGRANVTYIGSGGAGSNETVFGLF